MDLREYLEEKDEKQFEEELNENILAAIGTALGYTIVGAALAFGGTLLVLGGKKYVLKMRDLWMKIFGKKPREERKAPDEVMKQIETDAKVKAEKIKIEEKKRAFEDRLGEVYSAIDAKDFDVAREEFYKLDKTLQNNPDVHKAIIYEITKVMKEPPLYVKSPGSECYQMIKKVLNIRVARASAAAAEQALVNAASLGQEV